ncbi:hypothetical protein GHK86_14015 [Acidimicrobiaceae bacterium USS-CC1]|uniref:DUF998 domain-containing protein n=1 Tax=Acidiferrimicrobium australe TaxID=2664430 RepID=A0ABW9QVX9_9ACTN|nr:hypothetical protein [Acidiferrimicrobium australe]
MTWAYQQPTTWSSADTTGETRTTTAPLAAAAVALIGAWAAIAAFVGPDFGYRVTTGAAWRWSTRNWMLHLAPGGAALLAGLLLIGLAASRGAKVLLGLLVVAAGAWLVIGPAVWGWLEGSAPYVAAASARASFLHQVGAALGPGLLLAALGAYLLSRPSVRVVRRRRTTRTEPTPSTAAPAAAEPPVV